MHACVCERERGQFNLEQKGHLASSSFTDLECLPNLDGLGTQNNYIRYMYLQLPSSSVVTFPNPIHPREIIDIRSILLPEFGYGNRTFGISCTSL